IDLRENPLTTINGEQVVQIDDYASSKSLKTTTGESVDITIPKSNVLIYHTKEGSRIAARPSGTEPKIKFYISVNESVESLDALDKTEEKLDAKIAGIRKELGL
ncbi:MAG: phospho-sugar mutase, partial [Bacteroidota bacterium]|nr:phospho-sugar mutase [Bacteroidota bacterium]